MRRSVWIFILAAAGVSSAFGQAGNVFYQSRDGIATARAVGGGPVAPVQGAPYSATMTDEMVQTLSDGTHIAQTTTGSVARDSQGRTRQDAPLPQIGNLSAANAPHLVFVRDPVTQVAYTLDLTDKTAQKMPTPPAGAAGPAAAAAGEKFFIQMAVPEASVSTAGQAPLPPPPPDAGIMLQKSVDDR